MRGGRRDRRLGRPAECGGGNEAVAPAGYRHDAAIPLTTAVERTAQGRDVDPEIALFDEGVADLSEELLLAEDLAGAFHQREQQRKRATADRHRTVPLDQKALSLEEAKGAERDLLLGGG